MATDLESSIVETESVLIRPSLKIVGLHIRGLKSISSLDLPEDGLGWGGAIPDFLMVGGINGSGKTTLLEFLASAFEAMSEHVPDGRFIKIPTALSASEARISVRFEMPGLGVHALDFLLGNQEYIHGYPVGSSMGFQFVGSDSNGTALMVGARTKDTHVFSHYMQSKNNYANYENGPAVVYFRSEGRTLLSPSSDYKSAARLKKRLVFVDRWRPPEAEWDKSLEARLYAIRWEDLNAKEEGRDQEAHGFEAYSRAFNRFFEGRKQLKWHRGELVVETKSGEIHGLSDLSSGEKQIILFMGELLHRWRPGSLILIDEPELHLHESFQTKLWESLVHWQKERGGQVIVATQSDHLFGLSGLGTRVILSGRRFR